VATLQTQTGIRIERLARELTIAGADAYFASSAVTLGYLQGLHETGGERLYILAISKDGRTRMICPALSASQAQRCGVEDIRAWRDGEDPYALLKELAGDWDLRSGVIAVDDDMIASYVLSMQNALPAALFRTGHPILSILMRSKDAAELDLMRTAGRIADEALPAALAAIRPGVSELELAQVLSSEMQKRGGKPTFAIVAAGPNSAEPHHHSDETVIRDGDVVIMDYGCDVGGYQSDITRTVCCGAASDDVKSVYTTVFQAHVAARSAIRPGVPAQEVDRAARKVIEDAGFGEFFIHRTGHGIGMRVHEEPYIIEGADQPLETGNCFSDEPGIYLPGRFGVRIENIVTVTEDGHSSLNAEPASEIIEVR
jgi:Xaa-Pro aminopeptidase